MNIRAPKFCMAAGCGELVRTGYCNDHKQDEVLKRKAGQRDYNVRGAESEKLYGQQKWRKLSIAFRKRNPLCSECDADGLVGSDDLVDDMQPAKSRLDIFFEWLHHR